MPRSLTRSAVSGTSSMTSVHPCRTKLISKNFVVCHMAYTLFCVSTRSRRRRAIFPSEMNMSRVWNARAMSEFHTTSARCSVLVHRVKS